MTGGTGFIGQSITDRLLKRGVETIALVRNPENSTAKAIQEKGAQLIKGDITEPETMREAMKGADAVIHNAGWYEFGITKKARSTMEKINVEGTKNTLQLAIDLGIPKIIYVSTILAFGDTGDVEADETFKRRVPYQSSHEETKTIAHEIALNYQRENAPVTIVCPAGVIGPGDYSTMGYLARMYIRGIFPPVLIGATGSRAHVYVDDAAEAIVLSMEKGKLGESYLLSNGVMSHQDTFDLWKKTPGGSKKTLFSIPKPIAMLSCGAAEPIQRLFGFPAVFSRESTLAAYSNYK